MLTTIKVHPMIDEDKAEVMKILLTTPEFTISEVEVAEELIDSYLEYGTSSGYHILVAEVALKPAGYICYGPTPLTDGTWDIHWLAVAPGSRAVLTMLGRNGALADLVQAGARVPLTMRLSRCQ